MREPSLSLKLADFRAAVGWFLGYGRGPVFGDPAWDTLQTRDIYMSVDSGYRRFLYPTPGAGGGDVYEWSFMRPTVSVTLVANQDYVDLEADFAGIDGQVYVFNQNGGGGWPSLPVRNEGFIRYQYSISPDTTGRPLAVALAQPKETSTGLGQTSQLLVWPLPDQAYGLQFIGHLLANQMTDSRPYPLGGSAHAETVRQACLAAAEQDVLNQVGVHAALFQERLAASIRQDRMRKPQLYGYTGNLPSWEQPAWGSNYRNLSAVTVNGVTPSSA